MAKGFFFNCEQQIIKVAMRGKIAAWTNQWCLGSSSHISAYDIALICSGICVGTIPKADETCAA
jgi:hypothetical protein